MKLKHCLSTILFLIPIWVVAQNSPVTITYERSGKGEVTFYADNISYTPYTVALTFTRLSGTLSLQEGDTHKATAFSRRKTRLLTLKPVTENAGIGFSYRFNITKGDWHAKTDTNFVYLFPLTEGKRVRMNHMVSLEKVLGSDDKSRLTGISFQTADGDTIVAARRGIVTEVQDNSASEAEHKRFSAKENFVEICQDDGTLPVTSCFVIMAFLSLREIRLSPDNLLESLAGVIMNEVHICVLVSIVLTCVSSRLFPVFIFLRGRRVNRLLESFMFQNTLKRLSCRR